MVKRISLIYTKIAWTTKQELLEKLNALPAEKIISFKECTPDRTDLRNWSQVGYEYHLR